MIRLGTRGSELALAQTANVARRLEAAGHEVETQLIKTIGDQVRDLRFAEIGAPGIFVREIEAALVGNRIDAAVHSYKDLPSNSPEGLTIGAIPERVDAADCLIVRREAYDAEAPPLHLRPGTTVATGSARREALLRALGPDLEFAPLRGNVPTRLEKLRSGPMQAIVLASAGLLRLDREPQSCTAVRRDDFHQVRLDPTVFVPAPGQGAVAVQCRVDDAAVLAALDGINDASATRSLRAERRLLAHVQGGCEVPFGAWCQDLGSDGLDLYAALQRGGEMTVVNARGDDADALADHVWQQINAAEAARQ